MKTFSSICTLLCALILTQSCMNNFNDNPKHSNQLINETSLYLLQHAYNPVHWQPWGEQALKEAQSTDKLLLISIGYSSCHWCHVMEKECFEDSAVAEVMNKLFVNIKIDREERPDLDQYYMSALQLMTGQGGWPLNIIALPDGRAVWGATYLPKDRWLNALQTVYDVYATDPKRVLEYADNLAQGISQSDSIVPNTHAPVFTKADLQDMIENWRRRFDKQQGGPDKAPKFPLPANYNFLLSYGVLAEDENVQQHVNLTLIKMARGGIYDQIGGGFARYSVDGIWKVPHFEKMLYDNAQLVNLYSRAYRQQKNDEYREVIEQTLSFLQREVQGEQSQYYAAIDADSQGEEGKFYVWKEDELKTLIPAKEWDLFTNYYNINPYGYWEHDNYILLRMVSDEDFAAKHGVSTEDLKKQVKNWQKTLLEAREKRVRPGLDTKALTAWNGMMVTALAEAHLALNHEKYLKDAMQTATFIRKKLTKPNGKLWHTYSAGQAKIDGFLDDYAHVIEAWLKLFEITGDENWLTEAEKLAKVVIHEFDAGPSGMFYFASAADASLTRSIELSDNVIPASNSVMAHNLYTLGLLLDKSEFRERAKKMAMQVKEDIFRYGEGYGHWAALMMQWAFPAYEVVIAGSEAKTFFYDMQHPRQPNLLFAWSNTPSGLPVFQNRFDAKQTRIFVCRENACQLPANSVSEAWKQISP